MEGYKTFVWLAGMVFADRGFVARVDKLGLDGVIAECPFGDDMSPSQRRSFWKAFNDPWLRFAVKMWWLTYDFRRRLGKVPDAQAAPWRP